MKIKQKGFTLIELMIAVAIVGILTSVGYPSYQNHIRKAKRVEAQGALVAFATAMEQWRVENNSDYTIPTGTSVFADQVPTDGSGTKTYSLAVTVASDGMSYTLTATPFGTQASDECGALTLKNTGEKGANGISPDTAGCWD